MDTIHIEIIRNDDIDAFGAYAKGEHLILFNVDAHVIASVENDISLKEIALTTLMHEFGHCMEEELNLNFSEERIEKIIETYRSKYTE